MFALRRSTTVLLAALGALVVSLPAVAAAEAPYTWETKDGFQPLTKARIEALPESERGAWLAYWAESEARMNAHRAATTDVKPPAPAEASKSTAATISKGLRLRGGPEVFATEEARALADQVVAQQSAAGAWTKGNVYSQPLPPGPRYRDTWSGGTIDNEATTTEIRFLARVITGTPANRPEEAARVQRWRDSFDRALGYVFAAQYPNGGFPQIYPLVGGYHDAITYNDNATYRVLEILRDIDAGHADFAFVSGAQRAEAKQRFARGIAAILATQIRDEAGRRTVWCQQHDPLTLKPCAARNFEPVASCTAESASLVDFLMRLPARTPAIEAAIEDAISWFERAALRDLAVEHVGRSSKLVPAPGASLLWGRMHQIGSDKPIFGDRDRSVHFDLGEVSPERQQGYAWFGNWPQSRIDKWRKDQAKDAKKSAAKS